MRTVFFLAVAVIVLLINHVQANAAVTEFWFRNQWQNAAGPHVTIDFQGYPKNTLIDDECDHLGLLFPDGNDVIDYDNSLLNDGVGLRSSDLVFGIITIDFDEHITAVGADFQGHMDIWLYADGALIWESTVFSDAATRFGGLTSTVPFDRVLIRDPTNGTVSIDDLYFGPPIPAPGGPFVVALAALSMRRRRSR
jgi:hypothetical protein